MVRSLFALSLAACQASMPAVEAQPPTGAVVSDPTLDRMIAGLDDEHPEGFGESINWLVAHPDVARPALRSLVTSRPDDLATARGLVALARIGAADDVEAIRAVLLGAKTETGMWEAAKALGAHPNGVQALVAATRSPSPGTAGAAASVLGEHRVEAARPAVEALLQHPDAGVRYRAVRALEALGVAASAGALRAAAVAEKDADVKAALAELGVRGGR